jgi:hypothetical protein
MAFMGCMGCMGHYSGCMAFMGLYGGCMGAVWGLYGYLDKAGLIKKIQLFKKNSLLLLTAHKSVYIYIL